MNRTDRLVAMVTYLQGRRLVRAEELAHHFEVSERTIYRDMAALGEAGVPIIGEAGVGYTLVKGYHLPPVMFTADEAMALAVGEDLVRQFTDKSLATPMATALLKIRSVLPRDRQDDLDRLGASTAIEGRGSMTAVLDHRTLLPIQQAVVARRLLHLRYRDRHDQESERLVEPLGVVYYGDAWYLVCWCRLRDDYRHLKLARIAALEVRPERFQPREGFTLQSHLQDARNGASRVEVVLRFAAKVLDRARRESFMGFVAEQLEGEGTVVVTMRAHSIDWIARWLLSFGTTAEALEPPELRQQVAACAREVAEKYEGVPAS